MNGHFALIFSNTDIDDLLHVHCRGRQFLNLFLMKVGLFICCSFVRFYDFYSLKDVCFYLQLYF